MNVDNVSDSEILATAAFLVELKRRKQHFISLIHCFVLTMVALFSYSLARSTILCLKALVEPPGRFRLLQPSPATS